MKPVSLDFLYSVAQRESASITKDLVRPAVYDSLDLPSSSRLSEHRSQPGHERADEGTTGTTGVWEVNLCEDDHSDM